MLNDKEVIKQWIVCRQSQHLCIVFLHEQEKPAWTRWVYQSKSSEKVPILLVTFGDKCTSLAFIYHTSARMKCQDNWAAWWHYRKTEGGKVKREKYSMIFSEGRFCLRSFHHQLAHTLTPIPILEERSIYRWANCSSFSFPAQQTFIPISPIVLVEVILSGLSSVLLSQRVTAHTKPDITRH